jgi:1-acyl-sn-glycerol-3-phosphate acyltransferase
VEKTSILYGLPGAIDEIVPDSTTAYPERAVRIARLGLHLVRGIWLLAALYPRCTPGRQRGIVRRWSRQLLSIVNVRLDCHDTPQVLPEKCVLVANHVSWLDIIAISAVFPAFFVAKSEIRAWLMVGELFERIGTIFIRRRAFRGVFWANRNIAWALDLGRLPVAVFPEGTTTRGECMRPFRAALLQPAIDSSATVLPVSLRYQDTRGVRTEAAAWVDNASLLSSIIAVLAQREIVLEMRFLPGLTCCGRSRREIAALAQSAVSRATGTGFVV